jgi:ubiquinone/menaquinone biosynthesis C-methylase UbiE
MPTETQTTDQWSAWLLHRRHGGDPDYQLRMRSVIESYRDRVLDSAHLSPGTTLLDIGVGDGLLAFGAIDRIGPSLTVILTDISQPLLNHTEQLAIARGCRNQCTFLQGSADKLDLIAGASIDTLVTRAVLAYVQNKPAAFREFHRVLKPAGRLSICEPILQDEALEAQAYSQLVQTQPNHPNIEFLKLVQRYRAAAFPSAAADILASPITNFNERDLFRFARDAGFTGIHVELHIDLQPALKITWEGMLDVAVHPCAPTLREILAREFSPPEAADFERIFRPIVEKSQAEQKQLVAYLTADKKA